MNGNKDKYSRRVFIEKYLYTGSLFLGGGIILSCTSLKSVSNNIPKSSSGKLPEASQDTVKTVKSSGSQQAQAIPQKNPCDDLTGVSAEDIEKRRKLAYVNKTPIPDSHCSNCTLYLPPGKDKPCGGCMLFKGSVRAEGYCAYWAPIAK